MKEYAIYWIRDEFAYRYFYKNDILYRFIKSYENNKGKDNLIKQYKYITKEFSKTAITLHLENEKYDQISIEANNNEMILSLNGKSVFLTIHKRHLIFYCKSIHEAEELLFPLLRLISPFLFIIDLNQLDYGWISPVKKRIRYKSGQLLYSHL